MASEMNRRPNSQVSYAPSELTSLLPSQPLPTLTLPTNILSRK